MNAGYTHWKCLYEAILMYTNNFHFINKDIGESSKFPKSLTLEIQILEFAV